MTMRISPPSAMLLSSTTFQPIVTEPRLGAIGGPKVSGFYGERDFGGELHREDTESMEEVTETGTKRFRVILCVP